MARPPLILVTGASQGIGAAIAKAFARDVKGVRLLLVARNARGLATVAKACLRLGAREAVPLPTDLTEEAAVGALSRTVIEQHGVPDVLINNAGSFKPTKFLQLSVADFDQQLNANLRSVFLVSRAFAPAMAERRSGDIFNMSSIAGLQAYPGGAAYCAAKFGLTGLSRVMRAELRESGVRVCTVFPGATDSPSWDGSGVPKERLMPAEDVAAAFLAAWRLSRRSVLEELVLRPQLGDL